MILPLLFAALAFIVLFAVLRPLWRGTTEAPRGHDQAVYRDQLLELDRDIARGLLRPDESATARLEIQRRLLAADRLAPSPASTGTAPWVAACVGLLVAIGTITLYDGLSTPTIVNNPTAIARAEAEDLMARLRDRLALEPTDRDAWLRYGRAAAVAMDWDTAIEAYRRALELDANDSDNVAALAEVLVARAGGFVIPEARRRFEEALRIEPGHAMARYYMALAAGQDGDAQGAIEQLQAVAADLPDDAPVRAELRRRINDLAREARIEPPPALAAGRSAGPNPDQATVEAAANLPAADRAEMIRAMVERLAERLANEPNDFEGWLRLARSRAVLGDHERAADAYERAATLRPGDPSLKLRAVEALMQGRAVTDPLPPRVIAHLRAVEVTRPDEPAVLWYLGLAAAGGRDRDRARAYWRRLIKILPEDHPDATLVKSALAALGAE